MLFFTCFVAAAVGDSSGQDRGFQGRSFWKQNTKEFLCLGLFCAVRNKTLAAIATKTVTDWKPCPKTKKKKNLSNFYFLKVFGFFKIV